METWMEGDRVELRTVRGRVASRAGGRVRRCWEWGAVLVRWPSGWEQAYRANELRKVEG